MTGGRSFGNGACGQSAVVAQQAEVVGEAAVELVEPNGRCKQKERSKLSERYQAAGKRGKPRNKLAAGRNDVIGELSKILLGTTA